MSTVRCPQCSAAVAAGTEHCPRCGYPLDWEAKAQEPTESQAGDMVRLPGEAATGDQTSSLPTGSTGEDSITRERPPPTGASGRTTECRSCGAVNPAERTLCERCGAGLNVVDDIVVRGGVSEWGPRAGLLGLVAVLALGGAVVAWLMLSGRDGSAEAQDGQAPAQDGGGTTTDDATAPSPGPEVLLEEGDRGETVQQWQELLSEAGLDVAVDGQFGAQTARATRRFQATIGEEPTGQVTTVTMAAAQQASSMRVVDVFLLRDGQLDSVKRRVDEAQLARGALRALLDAPLQAERADGLLSAVPAGTTLEGFEIDGGVAAIELVGFGADPGPQTMRQRVDQVVATLTQFGSVDSVRFALPEDDVPAFEEAGVSVTEPVRGADG